MRCRKCGKEILDDEVFCEECKNELKRASSRSEVRELEELIESQMNELEATKELVELDELQEELDEINKNVSESLNEEVVQEKDTEVEDDTSSLIDNTKKRNKKLIIILAIIISLIVIALIIIFLVLARNKKELDEPTINEVIDYEKILNDYGTNIEKTIEDYMSKNEDMITWQQLNLLLKYDKHDVVCDVHNIYSDGSIYLNECKIDNKKIKYSYGTLKEEEKEGLKIDIYKESTDSGYYYTTDSNNSTLVGTVTCKTDNCKYINAYDKYALIKEDKYYLYNYENNEIEFGPFDMESDEKYVSHMISYSNKLYGILYKDSNNNLYNVELGKTFKDIKGEIVLPTMSLDTTLMYKYGYIITKNSNQYDFISLKTGKVGFTVKENISSLIEDSKSKVVYILAYKSSIDSFKVYNSNGKLLFDGNEFNMISIIDDGLIVANKTKFDVYDSKLKLKFSSKKYNNVFAIYNNYILVLDDKKLELLNSSGKVLATFIDDWSSNRYEFYTNLSGIKTKNNKYGIYLYVIDNDILDEKENEIEYYYIFDTKEFGKTESND